VRDVAIVSVAVADHVRRERMRNEVEILMPVVHQVIEDCGIPKEEIGFTCSGTSDFLAGQPFSFVKHDLAEVAARYDGGASADQLLEKPYLVSPLRVHDCPPIADGAAAVVLAAGELAAKVCSRPAWIRGIDHRIEQHQLGSRDLTMSPSTALAAQKAGVGDGTVNIAELHAPFTHQELIVREAMKLGDDVTVNPSGGPLAGNPVMVAGLERFVHAARAIHRGEADRAVAHATSGPCLQQNLVAVLEASS
jgi:acetyl-CoA acetyltransferase